MSKYNACASSKAVSISPPPPPLHKGYTFLFLCVPGNFLFENEHFLMLYCGNSGIRYSLPVFAVAICWVTVFFFLNYLFILLYNIVLVLPYIDLNLAWVYMCAPSWIPLPTPSPSHPSRSSQYTSPEHPVSCIEPELAICLTYDNLHVSMPFSHIIPPSPSPTESKRLFNTSVSLLLFLIQGYHYHLSKFHINALVYCIGVFLSGLLHSV